MTQFISKKGIYFAGSPAEILKQIKKLEIRYTTVKELIDSKTKFLTD